MEFLKHPKIKPDTVDLRKYQVTMAEGCLKRDTLIILPTGLGKTVIALIVMANVLEKGKKIMLLAPTKPLVDQHYATFSTWLIDDIKIGLLNGNIPAERRQMIVSESDLIISTPQAVANDLENNRYDLNDFGLVIYDEAHRGIGNFAYVIVAQYNINGISMGMTASPGGDHKKVMEVCQNLCFTKIDMRTEYDPDVSPYVFDTMIQRIEVNMPKDLLEIIRHLNGLLDGYVNDLIRLGMYNPNRPISTSYMLEIGNELQYRVRNNDKSTYLYRGLVVQSICVKILHCKSLAETQGMSSLRNYLDKLKKETLETTGSKSSNELISNPKFKPILDIAGTSKVEHPKISKVMSLVSQKLSEKDGSKIMVFANYRDTCEMLVQKLSVIDGAVVEKLIGQSKGGLKQKEQVELLNRFRNGDCNVIVSTSVGEEGLDISSTQLVIFYEPVASEIRTIQRRGRTGRKNDGQVIVLIAKGTVDEAFEKSSNKKEEQMIARLDTLNWELARTVKKPIGRGQKTMFEY